MERAGSANMIAVLLKEIEMSGHQPTARVRMIGVVSKQRDVQHLKPPDPM
jgi:hypothetical protein